MAWWHQHHTICNANRSPYSILHDFWPCKIEYTLAAGQWRWQQSAAIKDAAAVVAAAVASEKTTAAASGHRRCPPQHGPLPRPWRVAITAVCRGMAMTTAGTPSHTLSQAFPEEGGGVDRGPEVEVARQDVMQQLAGANEGRGWGWTCEAVARQDVTWQQSASEREANWRRGASGQEAAARCEVKVAHREAEAARGQVSALVQQAGQCDNQLSSELRKGVTAINEIKN